MYISIYMCVCIYIYTNNNTNNDEHDDNNDNDNDDNDNDPNDNDDDNKHKHNRLRRRGRLRILQTITTACKTFKNCINKIRVITSTANCSCPNCMRRLRRRRRRGPGGGRHVQDLADGRVAQQERVPDGADLLLRRRRAAVPDRGHRRGDKIIQQTAQ